MVLQVQVAILGEGNAGKDSLLRAMVQAEQPQAQAGGKHNPSFWEHQRGRVEASIRTAYDGKEIDLNFELVQPSRGRRSNRMELYKSMEDADCLLFCVPLDAESRWAVRSLSHAIEYTASNSTKIVIVGTKVDLSGEVEPSIARLSVDYPFVATSTVTRQGLADVVPSILEALFADGFPAELPSAIKKKLAKEATAPKASQLSNKDKRLAKKAEAKQAPASNKADKQQEVPQLPAQLAPEDKPEPKDIPQVA